MRVLGRLRRVEHDERLSMVDHLEELRSRMILGLIVVAVAFGVCFWQNHRLLRLIDAPLAHQTQAQVRDGGGPLGAVYRIQQGALDVAYQLRTVVAEFDRAAQTQRERRTLRQVRRNLTGDLYRLSVPPQGDLPVTLGIGEPFTTTVTVTFIFALILSLPIIFAQAHAFLLPAFTAQHRREMRLVTATIPLLFVTGVGFGYFVVLPAAVHFFLHFNSAQFNVLEQASSYYKFAATTLLAMGVLFEVPVAILAVVRAGVVTPHQLRHNRRYAVGVCALVAAALPGDAVTMLFEAAPLYLMFELSILVAAACDRRMRTRQAAGQAAPSVYGG
jgi:sec-independent protein translocase protein TatC